MRGGRDTAYRMSPWLLAAVASLLVGWLAAAPSKAWAQTAPGPASERGVKEEPSAGGKAPADESQAARLYREFRDIKKKLPFKLGAGFYLYMYQPVDKKATEAYGSYSTVFEIWALWLELDKEYKGFGAHVQVRAHDLNSLRSTSITPVWFQLAYAYWNPSKLLKLRIGKIYRSFGLEWDDSFYGSILYYDGLLYNPDWGLSADGGHEFADGSVSIAYTAQYFIRSDDVQGGYTDKRLVGRVPSEVPFNLANLRRHSPAPESERDSAGNPLTVIDKVVSGRLVLGFKKGELFSLQLGGSAETGLVSRNSSVDHIHDDGARFSRFEGDLTLAVGPVSLMGEYFHQSGPGMRDADYLSASAKGTWRSLAFRLSSSYVRYYMAPTVEEYLLIPGVTWTVGYGLILYGEYAEWQRRDPRLATTFEAYDRSINLSIEYDY